MVKVECDSCKAPYQIDEKRIPAAGLKMRCPKCGTNLVVKKPGTEDPEAEIDLPANVPSGSAPRRTQGWGMGGKGPGGKGAPAAGFGEVDIDTPALPVVRPGSGVQMGKPSPPRSTQGFPSGTTGGDGNPPSSRPAGGFGEIDLAVDLPAPAGLAGPTEPSFHEQPSPEGEGEMDLSFGEAGSDMAADFGDVDLPAVHGEETDLPDLPSLPKTGAELPAVRGAPGGKPRGRTVRFGDVDLPDLPPQPAGGRRGRTANFGEIDLPSASGEPGLPANRPGGPQKPFGEIDLPLSSGDNTALPSAKGKGQRPPPPPARPPMPTPVTDERPVPVANPRTGAARRAAEPAAPPSSGDPFARGDETQPPSSRRDGLSVGDELSLGPSSAPASSRRRAFDDSDRAVPTQEGAEQGPDMSGAIALGGASQAPPPPPKESVGDEAELTSEAGALGEAPLAPPPEPVRPTVEAAPKRKKNNRRVVIFASVLLAVGGASLALEPSIGPFGVNIISDQLNAKKHAAMLEQLRAAVQADLDEDTSAAAGRALQKAKDAQATAPRYRPVAAYCAYVALARSLRFGHRSEDDALAKQLLANADQDASDALTLATAAQAAGTGQIQKARQTIVGLVQRAPSDPDATSLAGEIELAAKPPDRAPDQALAAWKQAVSARGDKKSARALFGLARAQVAMGDTAGAEASARAVIEASPQHAGARTLLASLLWLKPEREADALGELKKVTEDANVRGATSDPELVDAFTLLGRIHLARSRISAADQAFGAALKLDPQAVQALIGNGELFYQSGRFSEASARFEAASRADESNVRAKVGTAKTLLGLERMKEAKDLLKKLREAYPKEPQVAFWLGRVEEALGNKKEAEAEYNEAIKVGEGNPEVVDAYVALARLLSGTGRTDDANAKLLDASKRFPDLPALHKAKGELLLQTGRYEEAKAELTAALEKDDDLGTRFKLGVTYLRLRAFDEASKVFDKVASIDKDYPGLALERGLLFESTGQSDRALEMYSDALRKAPKDIDLKLRVGSTQVIAGHTKQAEEILREVVRDRPNSAEANHFLGRAILAKGTNPTEALPFLEKAVSIDGNRAEFHLYVGWAANEAGQVARAEIALQRALELDSDLADAYWQRGVLRQLRGASVDALADLRTALEKRPSRYEAYATMALCYETQSQWAEAEASWRKAIAGNGSVAEWHFRLGKVLANHGNQAAALPELEQAVTLAEAPDHPTFTWLYDAYFLLAEAERGKSRDKAIQHYRRFIELAPRGYAYIEDAKKALASLGADKPH